MKQFNHSTTLLLSFLLAVSVDAAAAFKSLSQSECGEYVADNGYGYPKLFSLEEIGSRDPIDGHIEVEFYVDSERVLQLVLNTAPTWSPSTGTPFEIQNYNNQVFMVMRRKRLIAKINRNYILYRSTPVPMVLRLFPATFTIELQVIGEHEPFLRVVEPEAIDELRYIGFGTHGPHRARYLFACTKAADQNTAARDEVAECDDFRTVQVRTDGGLALAPIALDRAIVGQRSADETFNLRLFASLDSGQPSLKLSLHAVEDFRTLGSPFYTIEFAADWTLWRGGLEVATRRPNVDALATAGQRVLVNVSIKRDGTVHIWLNDLQSQALRFEEEYPIDLRYVTFARGTWTYANCV